MSLKKNIQEFSKDIDFDFPTRKNEDWKYFDLKKITEKNYVFSSEKKVENIKELLSKDDTHKIVFVNSILREDLSKMSCSKVKIEVLQNTEMQNTKTVFHKINSKLPNFGLKITVNKNKVKTRPIEIVSITDCDENLMINPNYTIILEENSQVKIIERHIDLSKQKTFVNTCVNIISAKSSILDYYKMQGKSSPNYIIDNTEIIQKRKSNCSVSTFSFGGEMIQNNLNFIQNGEFLESNLNGLSILKNSQVVGNHTFVHHRSPNCQSNEIYKGLYFDESHGVFNGKVYVDKIAQKTDAYQQNDNILIGTKSKINAKPQLEIFADDVKCSHGCTIGQMSEESKFYMQSRGISESTANKILQRAFVEDVMNKMKIDFIKKEIENTISFL